MMSYYIPPKFLDRLAVHITKNFLDLPNVKVPLILGIHGRKGEGKTFMCELVFKRMGIGVVLMSAGELESPDAGDPARLIRLRYREAGEWSRVNGRMAVLMINDVDAGIGRVDGSTQYTVNTQLVNATLMNIADNPTNVQLPGSYDAEPTQRIPVILTGNDFATLYAPLIRDGRMEKFFWDPTHEDRVGIVSGMFEADGVSKSDIEKLVNTFPAQATDFFGALRSRLYDEQIAELINAIGIDKISQKVVHSDGKPTEFRKPNFTLGHLVEIGNAMVREQDRIRELRLVEEYNVALKSRNVSDRQPASTPAASPQPSPNADSTAASSGEYFAYYGHSSDVPDYETTKPRNGNGHANHQSRSSSLDVEIVAQIEELMRQGNQVAIEVVDARRFRTGSWQSYGVFDGDVGRAIAALEACLQEHARDYVRIVGISGAALAGGKADRRRILETVVQRPSSNR
ncbi:AAA family ATPase [Leptolyngbya sp. AN02str]|uniref:AAA family ATPase n=1 Tax=Leptolyngbya sp. AN02str TaxID=3423363 RepID=UPI003D31D14B